MTERAPKAMAFRRFVKLGRFAAVGALSTACYFVLGWTFARPGGLSPVAGSAAAYACAALLSYAGHRSFTFRSAASHHVAGPRFVALTAAGFALATSLSAIGERMGLPPEVALAASCLMIPSVNYILLDRLVFSRAVRRPSPRATHGV